LNEALDEAYEIEKENEQNNNCSRANSVNLLTEVSESLQSQIDIKSEELKKLGKNYSNLETLHAVSINQIDDYKKELDDCFAIFNQQKELIEEKEAQLTNNERIKQAQLEFIISCQRSIYQLNREKEELEQELDKLLENFDSEQIENDYLHKKLDDLQDLLGITEDDIENLTNLAKTLEGRTI
jgi:chromosome segregation ATPase